ncbi:MAG: hypothetical protein B7X60_14440, partial [Polynucleobacter sp. 39-45-136]
MKYSHQASLLGGATTICALLWWVNRTLDCKKQDNPSFTPNHSISMGFIRNFAAVLLGLALSVNVFAQAPKQLTINELITMALESNPQVLAARDQSKAVKGQLSTARAIPNPEFEVNTGQQKSATGPLTTGNVSSWSVTQ